MTRMERLTARRAAALEEFKARRREARENVRRVEAETLERYRSELAAAAAEYAGGEGES